MTRKIKHVSELPEWFQLEKYVAAKNLTAEGWYQQIDVRFAVFDAKDYRNFTYLDEESNEVSFKGYYDNLLKNICCKPIIDTDADDIWKDYKNVFSYERLFAHDPACSGIRSISLADNAMVAKTICSKKLETVQKFWDQAFDVNKRTETEIPSYGSEPIYKFGDGCIRFDEYWDVAWVDLALPDNLLIENFKNYLKFRRETMQDKIENIELYKKSNFESWCRFGVLPFIDLYLWSHIENIRIPYRVMADAIFPSGERGEETIRKTTRPLAQFLLTDISRRQLASLAIAESAEKKSN